MDGHSAVVGLGDISWLWVLVSAVAAFLIGGLWYSPVLFVRPWKSALGITDESGGSGRPLGQVMPVAFVVQGLSILALALFLGPDAGAGHGACAGAVIAVVAASAFGTTYLYEGRPLRLWLINAGYFAVTLTVAGLILGAWG